MLSIHLPQILLNIAVEDGFLSPAGGEEGLADGGFDVGGDGTAAVVVLVVAFAREEADEAVLDGTLQMMGHVVVHPAEAEGHTDGLIRAILGTIFSLHLLVPEVDAGNDKVILGDIVLEDVAQAMFPKGAVVALTDSTFCRHFSESLFLHSLCIFG